MSNISVINTLTNLANDATMLSDDQSKPCPRGHPFSGVLEREKTMGIRSDTSSINDMIDTIDNLHLMEQMDGDEGLEDLKEAGDALRELQKRVTEMRKTIRLFKKGSEE